ncbi:LmeA family phospholipid-binding protein [Flexivirga endophytica]|uniref:LmeA family phospholipid-binding protein n=1 Tax=Flexivirga endophytica TaxID=1849103 RepID=UPI0016651FDE|nr:DUF2993 domain-containing protein [Flexivirga endophytica]
MTEQSPGLARPAPVPGQAPTTGGTRRPWLIGIVAAFVVVALVVGAEVFARHQLRSKVSDAMANGLHTSRVDVGIGSSPALLDLGRGTIDQVSLNARKATVCQVRDVSLDAKVHDVSTSPSGGRIGASELTLTLTGKSLNDLLAGSGKADGVTATTRSGSDTVRLTGLGGLARVQVRPKVTDGKLDFTVVSASFAGRPVPAAQAQKLLRGGGANRLEELPLGLRATAVQVTDAGLETSFRGEPTTLPEGKQPLSCAGG